MLISKVIEHFCAKQSNSKQKPQAARRRMSDTEQHKKRKLDEVAPQTNIPDTGSSSNKSAAASIKAELIAEIAATSSNSATTPAAPASSSENPEKSEPKSAVDSAQQLAKEKEKIMKLLEPFSREQLVEILTSAASQYDNIYNEIKTVASADVAHRKVFIRGLAWETSTETLKDAFSSFGEVEEGAVIYDKATGKSRGYGFVTFADMDAAQRAVEKQIVEIDGRRATCNLAAIRPHSDDHQQSASSSHQQQHNQPHQQQQQTRAAGPPPPAGPSHTVYTTPVANQMYPMVGVQMPVPQQQPQHQQQQHNASGPGDESERKLFVRGLSWDTTNDSFRAEFQKYGELDEAMIAIDRNTGKSKGFGFITYKHKSSADRALQHPQKTIDGRTTTCNLASQGGSRGGGSDRHHGRGGMSGGGYPGAMAPVMPAAPVQAYAVPMYTAMSGPYGAAPQQVPMGMPQQPVQYGAYPAMAADPFHSQGYAPAPGAPAPAVQYYQNRPPPSHQQQQQQPKPPAPQRK